MLLPTLLGWLFAARQMLPLTLCVLLTVSALGVACATHITRIQYRDLQALEKSHDDLEHEYEKLLLEQSAWANYNRLDQLVRKELSMRVADKLVLLGQASP